MGSLILLAPRTSPTADGTPSWRAETFDVPRRLGRGLTALDELAVHDGREDARALHAVLAG
ncbi:hypothetical protein L6R52_40330, partial [Myxococcota bacterium]|nr:hypothetical protein [Myxococcota bacterium]